MRERAAPWFRTPVVTHALMARSREGFPLVADDGYPGICGVRGTIARGVPRCPDCAMAIEYAVMAGVGVYDEKGAFWFGDRAFPAVEKLFFGELQMMTPAGPVNIVASRMYAPHTVILETLDLGDEVKRLSIGTPDFTADRLMAEIMDEIRSGNRPARVVMMPQQWAELNSDMGTLRQYDAGRR